MKNTALVLIDFQNDYFPGGALELHEPAKAAGNAQRLLAACREHGVSCIHIQHEMPPERGVPFLLPGTEGQKIFAAVAPTRREEVLVKHYPNAFSDTSLLDVLNRNQIDHLILCGMMTHMCVSATARAALELGMDVTVVSDATATKALELFGEEIPAHEVQRCALAELSGIVATVRTSEDCLNSISGRVGA